MSRNTFKAKLQGLIQEVMKEYGFERYNNQKMYLIQRSNDFANTLLFECSPMRGTRFIAAVQPLYVPCESLHITFGYRLRNSDGKVGYWGNDTDKIDEDIEELRELVHKEAMPFIEKVSSPLKIVNFIHNNVFGDIKFPPSYRNEYLAYSLLKLKRYEEAVPILASVIEELEKSKFESAKQKVVIMRELELKVCKKEYELIDMELSKNASELSKKIGWLENN